MRLGPSPPGVTNDFIEHVQHFVDEGACPDSLRVGRPGRPAGGAQKYAAHRFHRVRLSRNDAAFTVIATYRSPTTQSGPCVAVKGNSPSAAQLPCDRPEPRGDAVAGRLLPAHGTGWMGS